MLIIYYYRVALLVFMYYTNEIKFKLKNVDRRQQKREKLPIMQRINQTTVKPVLRGY